MTESRPITQTLTVRRVAGDRGRGASSLYCFSYGDLAALIGSTPLAIAKAVMDGKLEPLSLVELVHARTHGLRWLLDGCDGDSVAHAQLLALRPEVVAESADAHPPQIAGPRGLDTLWALTYSDIADQLGIPVMTVRNAGKGRKKALDIRSLASVLDYVAARHPLLATAA